MRNIKVTISYDGTSYYGFQSQPNGNTVQDKIEEAIALVSGEKLKIVSSGRTDAGVHARRQVINFVTASAIPAKRWCPALNTRLPDDIVALESVEVPLSFHSRRDAVRKTYCYRIRYGRHPDVFQRGYEYHHYGQLDLQAMHEGLQYLRGTHDFTSFCSVRSDKPSHIRTIYEARLEYVPDPYDEQLGGTISIYLVGNGFLYNMVRIIVGTILQVGQGKRNQEEIKLILVGKNRALAGPTAVSHGLMLWDVEYT